MACSRCEQRRRALAAGAAALLRGDVSTAKASASFVVKTSAQDARALSKRLAKASLLKR